MTCCSGDATGQVLPAHMSASADSIVIRVQEDGAVYPVTICNSITAGPNFRIAAPGGDVTFRTRNSVILVNGFSVESGARLTIQLDP